MAPPPPDPRSGSRSGSRPDRALVVLARSGTDPALAGEAFQALYERYKDELFGFLAAFLRDDALAEDALQEAFLKVHERLAQHDTERSFRAWLFRIARNQALDLLRRQRKQDRVADAKGAMQTPPSDSGVVGAVSKEEAAERAQRALASLEPEEQALLLQRHCEGIRLGELAESFDCTERTVRNRLHRAAGRLAEAVLAGGAP